MDDLGRHVPHSDDDDHVLLVSDVDVLLPKEKEKRNEERYINKFRRFRDGKGNWKRDETAGF